ncbi:YadA-like family protein [uncultured Sneathia sp.]|uniref:YadA-like family protein n=1 Tax=uncultured Sneathia sp. TaxID=278067 RepID=UPI0025999898|nr:YadA-like family protein [uncultured Sneathia sp.]
MKNKIVLSILLILGIFSFADEEGKWNKADSGNNSYYFGEESTANGNDSYSVGTKNQIYGNNNQVHGDKNKVGTEDNMIDNNLVFGNNNEVLSNPLQKEKKIWTVIVATGDPDGLGSVKKYEIRKVEDGKKLKLNDNGPEFKWLYDEKKPIKKNKIIIGVYLKNVNTDNPEAVESYSKLNVLRYILKSTVEGSENYNKLNAVEKNKMQENIEKLEDEIDDALGRCSNAEMQRKIAKCEDILKIFTEGEPKQNDTPKVNIAENKSTPDFIGNIIKGNDNLVIGQGNAVFGTNVKLGEKNKSSVNNNIILGSNITNTDVNNAIVIGNGSKAIENAVSIGNDKTTRQIKYVKAGTDDTDAVNVSQLKEYVKANSFSAENYYTRPEVDKKIDFTLGGVANAVAMANLPQVGGDRKFNLAASYGCYGGSHAVAVGFSGTNDKQNFTYKLSGAVNSKGNLAFGIGAGVMMGSVNDKDKVIEQLKEENRKRDEKIDKQGQEIKELKEIVNKLIRK